MRYSCLVILCFLIIGCAQKSADLTSIVYIGDVSTMSNKSAQIELKHGRVIGDDRLHSNVLADGTVVQYTSEVSPNLHFNLEDQQVFVDSLKQELTRLKMLNVLDENALQNQTPTTNISVWFMSSHHDPSYNIYTLEVTLSITEANETFEKNYLIVSSKGDSVWARLNTKAPDGKKKAAQKLINKVISDIDDWLLREG